MFIIYSGRVLKRMYKFPALPRENEIIPFKIQYFFKSHILSMFQFYACKFYSVTIQSIPDIATPTPPIIFVVSVHFLVPICVFPPIPVGGAGEASSRPSLISWNLIFLCVYPLRVFKKSHSLPYPCTFILGLGHNIFIKYFIKIFYIIFF